MCVSHCEPGCTLKHMATQSYAGRRWNSNWTHLNIKHHSDGAFVRVRPCKDHHHSGGRSSFALGMATGEHLYLSGLDKNLSLRLQVPNSAFSESWLTHCLFSVCSKMAPKLKTGMANKSRLTLLFSTMMGWQSTQMGGGVWAQMQMWQMVEGEKLPEKVVVSRSQRPKVLRDSRPQVKRGR